MGRPRKNKYVPPDFDQEFKPPTEENENENESDMDAFLSTLDDDCIVYLTRREVNGDRSQCGKYAWDLIKEDPVEFIRKTWGAGKYWIRWRKPGIESWHGQKTLVIAQRPVNEPAAPPTAAAAPSAGVSSFQELQITLMREQIAQQNTLITTLITNSNRGGNSDVAQLLSGLGSILKPPDVVGQFTALMSAVRMTKETASTVDEFGKVKELIQLAKVLGNNGDGEGGWTGVLEKALEKLPMLLGPRAAAPAQQVQTPPPAQIPAAQPQVQEEKMQKQFMEQLTSGITAARAQFAAGVAPAEAAQAIWAARNEPANNAVASAIYEGATVDRLFMFFPDIAAAPAESAWFQALYEALVVLVRG